MKNSITDTTPAIVRASKNGRSVGEGKYTAAMRHRALVVIADCGGSLTIASQRLGVSIPTLSRWRRVAAGGVA